METNTDRALEQHMRTGYLPHRPAPAQLYPKILKRIEVLELRAFYMRRLVLSGALLFSATGLLSSFIYLMNAFAGSSFSQYLSLVISDGDILLLNWKEFAFSLIESLPLMAITLVSIAIFSLIYSVTSLLETRQRQFPLQLA